MRREMKHLSQGHKDNEYMNPESLQYCVYVLFSEKDRYLYVGFTGDIKRRIGEHQRGESYSTKNRRPLKLVFLEYYLFKEDALWREKYFKTTKGKRMLKFILADTFERLGYKPLEIIGLEEEG